MTYVEFPTDPLVRVKWKRKKGGDGGIPPDDGPPGPCGAWGYAGNQFVRYPNFFSPQQFGLWALYYQWVNGVYNLCWFYVYHTDPYSETYDYLWDKPASFTVSTLFAPAIPPDFSFVHGDVVFAIRVWRNINPLAFNPCTFAPHAVVTGGSEYLSTMSIDIEPQAPNEAYPPIFMLAFANPGLECTNSFGAGLYLKVQAHCAQQTTDALPPTIPGWPTNNMGHFMTAALGPPLPSSWFFAGAGLPPP